jgi:hypothetical protein
MGGQSTIKVKRSLGIAAALAVLLAGCTSSPGDRFAAAMPKATAPTPREPAAQRENARILASYGGTYDNARLQAMIEKTVDRRWRRPSGRPQIQGNDLNSPESTLSRCRRPPLHHARPDRAANDKAESRPCFTRWGM